MSDGDGTRSLFDPRTVIEVNDRPLQHPGRDRLIRTATIAGPELAGDRRFFLSTTLLEQCLSVARASPTGRCSLDRVGLRVDLYEDKLGHQYEVWTVIGVGPKPEPMPAAVGALIGHSVSETWRAERGEDGGVVLLRETECVACCKRRKDRCGVCGGTRIWALRYPLTREEAASFASSLSAAAGDRPAV